LGKNYILFSVSLSEQQAAQAALHLLHRQPKIFIIAAIPASAEQIYPNNPRLDDHSDRFNINISIISYFKNMI